MRWLASPLTLALLLVGSLAAPVDLSARAKPGIGSVVIAQSKKLDPIPLPGKSATANHPAIVVGHGPGDEIHVAPVSHTNIPPSVPVKDVAPNSGLDGFLHLGGPSRVDAGQVKVDAAGRTATTDEVKKIGDAITAHAPDISGDVADAVNRAKALAGKII